MAYHDRYGEYLEALSNDIVEAGKRGGKIAFGYTSNLDVLLKWDRDVLNRLFSLDFPAADRIGVTETIGSVEDLARIVSYYARAGLGAEVDITSDEVCRFLEANFKSEFALGGTGAQGAAALGAIGYPLLVHLTDDSAAVRELLSYPDVSIVSEGRTVPVTAVRAGGNPVRHFILQFQRGDVVTIRGEKQVLPDSNRLILDDDQIHKVLPIQTNFLRYIEENAQDFSAYSISGFNLITDEQRLLDVLAVLEPHFARVKEANPECVLYLEAAHYLEPTVQIRTLDRLSKHLHILGLNEEELVVFARRVGVEVDNCDLKSVLHGLSAVNDHFAFQGIVLHTKDYAMYFGQELSRGDLEKGLTLGNLLAGTKARIGHYGTIMDCRSSLALELSEVGLKFAEELATVATDKKMCLVPSRYMKQPTSTIGLGDTFTAGMQLGFI